MPSSGMPSIDMEKAEYIISCYALAKNVGLEVEWMAWFVGGVVSGVDSEEAASLAIIEWDIAS